MRIFKTKWFVREASSHGTSDDELYRATQSTLQGKVVSLGGGVYKERFNKNHDHTVILIRSAGYWFYTFLYVKQNMASTNHRELVGFRELTKHYANLSEEKTTVLVRSKELVEIYNGGER